MSINNENDEKKRKEIALFKYSLISPVLVGNVSVQISYFRKMAQKKHNVPYQGPKKYKALTFKKWLKMYRRDGFDVLYPKERNDKGKSRKIDSQLQQDIKNELETYPFLNGSALHRLLISEGKIRVGGINEGTLRKYIRDNQLRKQFPPDARKKFEKKHINQLWTADCMHGPYLQLENQSRKHKVFLIAAIDDHSRMICARGWFSHENSTALETALKEGIGRYGLPQKLYCDNGSIFSSLNLQMACARLGIALIHSKPYDSPSRGKIERYFRTVRDKFLATLQKEEISNLALLNDLFEHWLDKEYHKHLHTGIGETPMNRFLKDDETQIRRVSQHELDTAFQMTIRRKVKNDATISFNSQLYECPPQFIGTNIEIRYPSDKPQDLTIYLNNKPLVKIKKVNPHENADIPALGISFTKKEEKNHA
jgi:putative transposase